MKVPATLIAPARADAGLAGGAGGAAKPEATAANFSALLGAALGGTQDASDERAQAGTTESAEESDFSTELPGMGSTVMPVPDAAAAQLRIGVALQPAQPAFAEAAAAVAADSSEAAGDPAGDGSNSWALAPMAAETTAPPPAGVPQQSTPAHTGALFAEKASSAMGPNDSSGLAAMQSVTAEPAASQAVPQLTFPQQHPQFIAAAVPPSASPSAPPPAAPPLAEQLARPLFALATGPAGEHVMSIQVVPDTLGPVTVRAHLSANGVRIELVPASDAGQEALRGVLGDLRRDLAAGGLVPTLSLGGGNASAAGSGSGNPSSGNLGGGHAAQDHGSGRQGHHGLGSHFGSEIRTEVRNLGAGRGQPPRTRANNSLDITV